MTAAAAPVTLASKRYVFVCVGCGLLEAAERNDRLTCSPACRVRAHRNGRLRLLRALAQSQKIPAALPLQCRAIQILRPDLAAEIFAGRLEVEDTHADIYRAFIKRVFADAEVAS